VEPISSLVDALDGSSESFEEDKPNRPRLFWLSALVMVAILGLWFRLYELQVGQGAEYRDMADNNRFREVTIPAPRGVIYDRNWAVLARNRPSYSVGYVPADLADQAERDSVLRRLAEILNLDPAQILSAAKPSPESPFAFVELAPNVPESIAFSVEERHRDLPGVSVQLSPIRDYPLGPAAASILGYVGRISEAEYGRLKDDPVHHYVPTDAIGQTGLERTFESQLRGAPGEEQMEVDATGRQVRSLNVSNPAPGHNLVLTVDARLQQHISDVLTADIGRYQTASVVALDPRNGQVLAMVHQPSFDDNLFAAGISQPDYAKLIQDPRHPLLDGAVGAAYPPGAGFDPITAIAGLSTGVITSTTRLDCPGFLTVPNRFDPTVGTRLLDSRALGPQTVEAAVANNCNVFFYQVGGGDPSGRLNGVGVEGLAHVAQLFGLGDTSGIDLVEEVAGLVPSVRWKRQTLGQEWVAMDTYQLSVGQGYVTATPLQMANVAAAIANLGTLYRPQLVLGTSNAQGKLDAGFQPDVIRHLPVKSDYLDLVRRGMIDAVGPRRNDDGIVFDGATTGAAVDGWQGGGVASSVEFGSPDANGNLPTHGWFIGFGPAESPTIAIAVFLERGTGPGDAARIAKDIFTKYRQLTAESPSQS
jgi:penicillin-binding protein 2